MNRFAPILKSINDQLNLPQPTKSRILLEMAADLEDLFNYYKGQGLDEKEALQKAEEITKTDNKTLQQLVEIHDTGYRKLLHRLSQQAQTRWEKLLLFVVVFFTLFLGGRHLLPTKLMTSIGDLFFWPAVIIALAILMLCLVKFYLLFIRKEHELKKLRQGMPTLLFLCGISLLTGISGAFAELFMTSGKIMHDPENLFRYIVNWLLTATSVLIFSLTVSILAALLWFIFLNKILQIEEDEAAYLLN